MKPKKKSTQLKSTNFIKLLNIKTTEEPQKNLKSTKQKTFVTIQENLQTFDYFNDNSDKKYQINLDKKLEANEKRLSLKRNSINNNNKKSYFQRMQQNNLSPFSNDGRSVSPKYIRTPQKLKDQQIKLILNQKDQEKKKTQKNKPLSARQCKKNNKTISVHNNLQCKSKKSTLISTTLKMKKKSQKMEENSEKQQKARIQFQNEFLKMMNKRIQNQKITQKSSDEEDLTIRHKPKLQIFIDPEKDGRVKFDHKKDLVKTMRIKVMKNIQREYPNLEIDEKKVMCAVIIIQRLWRQIKVKQFFEHYVTPKSSPQNSIRQSFQKEQLKNNYQKLNIINNKRNIKKQGENKKFSQKVSQLYQNDFLIRQNSSQTLQNSSQTLQNSSQTLQNENNKKEKNILQSKSSEYQQKRNDNNQQVIENNPFQKIHERVLKQNENDKLLKESNILNRPSLMKFLECYRQMKLNKSKTKRNVFSLRQSLSEKCLMQKYYANIFYDKPQKHQPKNYQLFSNFKQSQKSLQLFNEINNQKDKMVEAGNKETIKQVNSSKQVEQIWLKNDVQYSKLQNDSDQLLSKSNKLDKNIIVDEAHSFSPLNKRKVQEANQAQNLSNQNEFRPLDYNEPLKTEIINKKSEKFQQKMFQPSIRAVNKVVLDLIEGLMNEFSQEFKEFTEKKCLTKKRKQKKEENKQQKQSIPGIEINSQTIRGYLSILIEQISKNDITNIQKSLDIFKSQFYIKCHRPQSIIYQIFEYDEDYEEEEEECFWDIVSKDSYFKCEESFEKKYLKITAENQKSRMFLELITKIHTRSLTDSFSDGLNKTVRNICVYPWEFFKRSAKTKRKIIFDQCYSEQKGVKYLPIQSLLNKVKDVVATQSFLKIGQLKRKNEEKEQKKIVKMIHNQYVEEKNEWQPCDQTFDLKNLVGQFLFKFLIDEFENQLNNFIEPILSKSQNEIFLETNETLETHNN